MTREEAYEILRHWDDPAWLEYKDITCGQTFDALRKAEEALIEPTQEELIDRAWKECSLILQEYGLTKDYEQRFRKAMTEKTNAIFERCLANVNPDIRTEVRKNMDAALIWHKASEELPEENKPVIVAFKFKGEWIYDKGYYADGEWWANSLSVLDIIEYWMHIPELPKED